MTSRVVEGGIRTTGGNPGRRPRALSSSEVLALSRSPELRQ